ncbi:MAG: hypothetical protein LBV71_20045 [Prevotella sp.]|jgi:hypothetical protein|nr:hypothetical protein [Prevotella sp.]
MNFLKNIFGGKDDRTPPDGLPQLKRNDNPVYHVYCIMGRAEREKDKLHYLNQWMKCYPVLDDFLKDCQTKSVSSEQTFRKVSSWSEDGYPAISIKNAPTGGILKWSEKNNRKICETHLEELLRQSEEAEKEGISHYDWMQKQFPERNVIINLDSHKIRARMEAVPNLNRYGHNDFIFILSPYASKPADQIPNQQITMFICDRYMKSKNQEEVDNFVRQIAIMANAIKIGKTRMPAAINEKNQHGQTEMKSLINRHYGIPPTCSFRPNPAGEWTVIYEK